MMEMSRFIEKLQNADEATKRRWMVVSSIVIMIIVIYVWIAYFNNLVGGFSAPEQQPSDASGGGFTFWQTMKNGTAMLYRAFLDKVRGFGNVLNAPREYIVKPPQ